MNVHRRSLLAVALVFCQVAVPLGLEPGLPSKTAIFIAASRAIGAKNPNPTLRNPDYLAIKFIGPRERAVLPNVPMDALDLPYKEAVAKWGSPAWGQVARTTWFDARLLDGLRDGARQVVILGAGFDSRGYRFQSRLRGVRFIEVDDCPTHEYKKRRVAEILGALPKTVTYVPMDFTKDNLLDQLVKAGYTEQAKTFFLWEGVTFYLPESAVKDTLHFVRDHAAPGSRLAFDYTMVGEPWLNSTDNLWAQWGEPWIFGFPTTRAAGYVRGEGLDVLADTTEVQQNMCLARVPQRHQRSSVSASRNSR